MRLTRVTGAGVEAEFHQRVETASDLAEAITPDVPEQLSISSTDEDGHPTTLADVLNQVDENPLLGALIAWREVSVAITGAATSTGVEGRTERAILRSLRDRGTITADVLALYERLSKIRNEIVHSRPTVTQDETKEFVTAAWRLAAELTRISPC
ncbi:hypothetical protein GCM10012284_28850 [Mangrovihabitans endophyticus]|uniref:DUF4145 domain-containing protein n=1 Tax=Mangrovihabitans endophyticus TaxID=1751298 RepID=A0A8J3FP67_9ACTN|nr:hypothetical protein GCM10012284_28850 [Mangrovihabitans endophyticus]